MRRLKSVKATHESACGSSGQPYFHRFEDGMIFGISLKREYFPDGSKIEGMGIKPDVEIDLKSADLRSGNDCHSTKGSGPHPEALKRSVSSHIRWNCECSSQTKNRHYRR